jgi:hypothetical protein
MKQVVPNALIATILFVACQKSDLAPNVAQQKAVSSTTCDKVIFNFNDTVRFSDYYYDSLSHFDWGNSLQKKHQSFRKIFMSLVILALMQKCLCFHTGIARGQE